MEQFIIGLFSPFILIAFILTAFCMNSSYSITIILKEQLLKPFFLDWMATVLGGINQCVYFRLGKLSLQACAHRYLPLEPFEIPSNRSSKHQNHSNDEPEIRIIQSDN